MIEFARNATVSGDSGTVAGVALSSVIDLYALPLMSARRFDSDVRDERGMVCVHARSSYRRRHRASRSQNNVIATRLVRLVRFDRWIERNYGGTTPFRGLVVVTFIKYFTSMYFWSSEGDINSKGRSNGEGNYSDVFH